MKVEDVITRVLADKEYAAELTKNVAKLAQSGSVRHEDNDATWKEVLAPFAESPEELAHLANVNSITEGSSWWTTTVATVTTTTATPTSPVTITSMTTMTTATVKQ